MSIELRIAILAFAAILIAVILNILQRGRMPIKYSLVWLLAAAIIMLVSLTPNFLINIARMLGFEAMSNMIIGMMIAILLFITIALTIIVSGQEAKIKLLIQEISLLKSKDK
jgi:hypothetical protein